MTGTSWLLGAGYPWYTAPDEVPVNVIVNDVNGLTLAALGTGAFGLTSADGSLGRLVLPRGVAVDGDTVLVLSQDGTLVYRYDPLNVTLTPLPHVGSHGLHHPTDDELREPRRFRGASGIATLRGTLYVADPHNHRVQVFDLRTLALLRIHADLKDPVDIASGQLGVYIVDTRRGRIYRAQPESDALELVVDISSPDPDLAQLGWRSRHWDRLAVDDSDRLYLSYASSGTVTLDEFTLTPPLPATFATGRIYDSNQVRDRFTVPLITTDTRGALLLPSQLLDPCNLRQPLAAAILRWEIGGLLYVADLATRAVIVYLEDGRERHRFAPLDAQGVEVGPDDPDGWRIVDATSGGGGALILDSQHQRIYQHRLGDSALRVWFDAPADFPRQWQRIVGDGCGCLLLWDGLSDLVDRFDNRGTSLGTVALRDVRARFAQPPSTRQPARDVAPVSLTRAGVVPRRQADQPAWPPPLYAACGTWTSQWLNSGSYGCAWDVVQLGIGKLPPGARLQVLTRTSNLQAPLGSSVPADGSAVVWQDAPILFGDPQPDPDKPPQLRRDVLVQSPPGQYLQLQVQLGGNGIDTPVLSHVRLTFPRESLLQYLPAIYSAPPEQHDFLERYLCIMQATWSAIENNLDSFQRFLDPRSVPASAMAYLASWLDLDLEGSWSADQNRELLKSLPKLRQGWGTVDGLRQWVRVYLANLGQVPVAELEALGLPGIVESFVERRRAMLSPLGPALEAAGGLWSPSVARRLQVGVFDQLGEVELVSTGDPQLDLFQQYAFSFRIYVPAAFVRTPEDEALLRRAIDMQTPAHTTYELVLVEARFRIGEQSTIDLDTVIGEPLPVSLSCAAIVDAPSRQPYQRLGYDATLAGTGHKTGLAGRLN